MIPIVSNKDIGEVLLKSFYSLFNNSNFNTYNLYYRQKKIQDESQLIEILLKKKTLFVFYVKKTNLINMFPQLKELRSACYELTEFGPVMSLRRKPDLSYKTKFVEWNRYL